MALPRQRAKVQRESKRIGRVEKARKRYGILTSERLSEFLLTNLFFGLESYYDISKVPENYTWLTGITRETAPKLALSPATAEMFNSLGDVLEISVGSGIVRFSLAVVEEIVKSEPVKLVVRNAMKHEALKSLVEKTIGTEKTEELSMSGEIKMSDDSQFWAALVPWTVVKAAHSLGLISLGAHDHIGAPVPHMLIGQAFAVASLVAVHYGTKNSEEILALTNNIFNKTSELASDVQQNISSGFGKFQRRTKLNMSNAFDLIDTKFDSMSRTMADWSRKMNEFDPSKVIPSPDQVWNKILGERVWNALASMAVENDKDMLDQLLFDFDAHGAGGAGDRAHGGFERGSIKVGKFVGGNFFELSLCELAHFGFVGDT